LLLFARPPRPQPTAVDVRPLVTTTADLLRQDPAHTNIHVDVAGSTPPVLADAGLIKIVFLNLFLNSAHAMRGKGVISVSVMSADNACQIAVADVGPGIPPDVREKLFTPFFTTKSRGTGLGLSTVKRVVEAHHGRIHVACPPGGGTR
jgi:signal transduction histidine kinase